MPGSAMIGDTAGFTNPKYNVSKVDVIAAPADALAAGQEAVAYGAAGAAAAIAASPSLGHGVGIEESIPSIFVVVVLTLIRVYFILVVMAYARQVLRSHVYSSSTKLHLQTDAAADLPAENPFSGGKPEGNGWRGKIGRVMVWVGESYWLGGQVDQSWIQRLDGKFKASKVQSGPPGTLERERRARSGTGPPLPTINLGKL